MGIRLAPQIKDPPPDERTYGINSVALALSRSKALCLLLYRPGDVTRHSVMTYYKPEP